MKITSNKGKKFAVLAVTEVESSVEVWTTEAENHEEAYHQAEIANGWGTFIPLDKRQIRRIIKELKSCLEDR